MCIRDSHDGGFWALTRHADIKAVSSARHGWSVEEDSAFVRLLDPSDLARETSKELLLCMEDVYKRQGQDREVVARAPAD